MDYTLPFRVVSLSSSFPVSMYSGKDKFNAVDQNVMYYIGNVYEHSKKIEINSFNPSKYINFLALL